MIIFNEKKFAEDLDKTKINTAYNSIKNGSVLAKLYFSQGMTKEEVFNKLCQKFIVLDSVNHEIKRDKINLMISVAKMDLNLSEKTIKISKKEIEEVSGFEDLNLQKFTFIMLCLYKYYDCNKFYVNEREVMKLSDIYWCGNVFNSLSTQLYDKGILNITVGKESRSSKSKIYYDFSDYFNSLYDDNDVILEISNYKNLVNYYLSLKEPSRFTNCQICNCIIFKSNNKKKYCKECAERVKRNLIK